jgi:Domain of unknown function (DUF4337)
MPELELHEPEGPVDARSKRVGILAALLAILLAVATISSHRAHTQAVVEKTEANDQWAFYQSKKLKSHVLELGIDLLDSFTVRDAAKAAEIGQKYKAEIARYDHETEEIQKKAEERSQASELAERRALRFDLGEGLLEMSLVLASMFFISKRNVFPVMALVAGTAGAILAASGYLISH